MATGTPQSRTKVFVSYSHADTKWLNDLREHIAALERKGDVDLWDDTRISPGQKWKNEIKDAIASAKVVVLLISPAFTASKFIATDELPPLLSAARNEGAVILPVIIRPTSTTAMGNLTQYQAVNPLSKPLVDMGRGDRDRVWIKLVEAITAALQHPTQAAVPSSDKARAGAHLNRLPSEDPRAETDEWVEIPGGEFSMGTTEEEIARLADAYDWAHKRRDEGWWENERPRKVSVPAFWIGKHPVTNAQYRRFVEAKGYEAPWHWSPEGLRWCKREKRTEPAHWDSPRFNPANHPVVGVTWFEAQAYCSWLTDYLRERGEIGRDQEARLPREAEWEFAARGAERRIWPWGDEWDAPRANTADGGVGATTAVGSYPSGVSPFGVFDMAGNVWEWCEDWYREGDTRWLRRGSWYNSADFGEDWYREGDTRCLRGGSWYNSADFARAAYRFRFTLDYWYSYIGFRCVVVPQGSPRT